MSWIIAKYRKEAEDFVRGAVFDRETTVRKAILESIFRPDMKLPDGKGPMTHLHPDSKNLHLPPGIHLPDWRKYRIEDHPNLVKHQQRCHAAGLHDPWLRNYCFNYYPNMFYTRSKMAWVTIGLGWGFCAGLGLYVVEKVYDHFYPTVYKHTPEYIAKYGTGERHH